MSENEFQRRAQAELLPVSSRQRNSPFPLIPLSEALDIVVNTIKPLPTVTVRVDHTLRNHVLAEDVLAQMDLPTTRTTNVDGYAVVVEGSELGPGIFPVQRSAVGEAGQKGVCYRINTGGPLPEGCNAVVMVEDTEVTKSAWSRSESSPYIFNGCAHRNGLSSRGE